MLSYTREAQLLLDFLESHPSSNVHEIALGTNLEVEVIKELLQAEDIAEAIVKVADTYSLK